jgi:hypothetical protein
VEGIPNQAGCWGIDKALFALIVGPLIFAQVLYDFAIDQVH